jgi:hypothetical protein
MADPKIVKAPEVATPEAPAVETKKEPFIPGVKRFPNSLNGKQTGTWKLRDHNGKIVHATDAADEAVHLFKLYALNGPGDEEEAFPGKFWAILPHDPRKEKDGEWVKEQERRKARMGKK